MQTGLCPTWLKIQKTGFLTTRLISCEYSLQLTSRYIFLFFKAEWTELHFEMSHVMFLKPKFPASSKLQNLKLPRLFCQGSSLREIWAKYSPWESKFRPILVSGRSGRLPKKIFFFSFHLVSTPKTSFDVSLVPLHLISFYLMLIVCVLSYFVKKHKIISRTFTSPYLTSLLPSSP